MLSVSPKQSFRHAVHNNPLFHAVYEEDVFKGTLVVDRRPVKCKIMFEVNEAIPETRGWRSQTAVCFLEASGEDPVRSMHRMRSHVAHFSYDKYPLMQPFVSHDPSDGPKKVDVEAGLKEVHDSFLPLIRLPDDPATADALIDNAILSMAERFVTQREEEAMARSSEPVKDNQCCVVCSFKSPWKKPLFP